MQELLNQRNETLRRSHLRLPGSVSYDNLRPINVPAKFEGQTLFDCLCQMHPHVSADQWRQWFEAGHILKEGLPVRMTRPVRGGQQYIHVFPDTVEPDVDAAIKVLWEDAAMIAVYKPAPLPVHPCGRFNLNTLTSLLSCIYVSTDLRLVHRLDANTTGLLLIARTRAAATQLRSQFEQNQVQKTYLTMCLGAPELDAFHCEAAISKEREAAGRRSIDAAGQPARTEFRVLQRWGTETTLLEARPLTGRTNQIRIHLWSLGFPVVGDPAYLPQGKSATAQTLTIDQPAMRLHAARLLFRHPATEEPMELVAPEPQWLLNPTSRA
jgi:UPF0176 protein